MGGLVLKTYVKQSNGSATNNYYFLSIQPNIHFAPKGKEGT
jgi:hypothetical protein